MYRKLKENDGAMLIEIILSLAILSIIIIPLYNALVTSTKINKEASDLLVAVNHASQVIEEKRGHIAIPKVIKDYAYQVEEDRQLSAYTLEEEIYAYDGLLRIEKINTSYQLTAYKYINNQYTPVGGWSYTNSMDVQVKAYANQIVLEQGDGNTPSIAIPYVLENKEIKIGVETYNGYPLTLRVRNELTDDSEVYIYTSKLMDNSHMEENPISVHADNGIVKTRRVTGQMAARESTTRQLLKRLKVKVSTGNTYSEQEKLVEIDTLQKE